MTSRTTTRATCGLWAVWSMRCATSNPPSVLKTCALCIARSVPESFSLSHDTILLSLPTSFAPFCKPCPPSGPPSVPSALIPPLDQLLQSSVILAHGGGLLGPDPALCPKPPTKHSTLLDTIKIPKNLRGLRDKLPKANYVSTGRNQSLDRKRSGVSTGDESRGRDRSVLLRSIDLNSAKDSKAKGVGSKAAPKMFEKHRASRAGVPPCPRSDKENAAPK